MTTNPNNLNPNNPNNLYVHFPFCRSRCSYCNLYSRIGSTTESRAEYVKQIVAGLKTLGDASFKTIYFGGGSPSLCDLKPLIPVFGAREAVTLPEFTVEMHPLDVTEEKLLELKELGVTRISMGVQSLDDDILRHMSRGYDFFTAERAFRLVKEHFDNAGIDLIVGYPGETAALSPRHGRLAKWGLRHCSVYSLQNERGLTDVVDDDTALNRIAIVARFLQDLGLERYEISNYAVPGFECRHNLAVWRGEDYLGLGEGAYGRVGLTRTRGVRSTSEVPFVPEVSSVSSSLDLKERVLFRLRTREGIDCSKFPEWRETLEKFAAEGLLLHVNGPVYRLTERGTEVCDTILAELV
jgi:oxygen-independent coproporphyrinogen III oxidase